MYHEVQVFLNTTAATRDLTALAAKVTTLGSLLTQLDQTVTSQTLPLAGVLDARDQANNAAIDAALAIAGPVHSYAESQNRPELAALVDLSRNDFMIMRKSERSRLAQRVLDAAQPLAADLAPFGVTAAMLTELETSIAAIKAVAPAPRTTVADKKTATGALAAVFKQIDDLLNKEIDPMLRVLAKTDAAAYARYQNARQIIDRPGTRSADTTPSPSAASATPEVAVSTPAVVKLAA